jgi:putative endonuclease
MAYFTYVALCSDNSLYSGYCSDVLLREEVHNSGKGAKYTAARRPVKIIYSEPFSTRSAAMKREAELKKLTRAEKLKLVNGQKSSKIWHRSKKKL